MTNTIIVNNNKIVFPKEVKSMSYTEFKKRYSLFNFGAVGIDRAYTQLTNKEAKEDDLKKIKTNAKIKGE